MGNLQEPIVLSTSGEQSRGLPNPTPFEIGHERWAVAEKAAQKIIWQFQPTVEADSTRIRVINYIRNLVKNLSGVEVFTYGSGPLKTYLPDGDIDLTAFAGAIDHEALASDILGALQQEEQNINAEFAVKEVRLINAEVKLVKCRVEDIAVDISFDQLGGLCALCFFEQVDHYIGRNHLFKQSVLLIKAWCCYESHILGAHHRLISTYALETLILYIFQVFHSALDGPLAVLYRFLDYFSKFDWDNYCITLRGPVRLSSLEESGTGIPENIGGRLLFTEDFFRYCMENFSVPLKVADMGTFSKKHVNIVDPLKLSNNLGRSINEGNFYRIKSALALGARKLGSILMHPKDGVAAELSVFFANTLDMHGGGQGSTSKHLCMHSHGSADRRDVQEYHLTSVDNAASSRSSNLLLDLRGNFHTHYNCLLHGRWFYTSRSRTQPCRVPPPVPPPPPPPQRPLHFQIRNGGFRGIVHGPAVLYPANLIFVQGASYGMPRPRGTGTYFPNIHQSLWNYRASSFGERIQASARSSGGNQRRQRQLHQHQQQQQHQHQQQQQQRRP